MKSRKSSRITIIHDGSSDISDEEPKTESEELAGKKKRKSKKNMKKKGSNTLLAMLYGTSSDSDSAKDEIKIDNKSKKLHNREDQIKSKISDIFMTTDEDEENQISNIQSKGNKIPKKSRSENHKEVRKNQKRLKFSKRDQQSVRYEKTIKCEESSSDSASISQSAKVSTEGAKIKTEVFQNKKKSKTEEKNEKKKYKNLLTVIDESTSNSESDVEEKSVVNKNKRDNCIKIKVENVSSSDDEEIENNYVSQPKRRKVLEKSEIKFSPSVSNPLMKGGCETNEKSAKIKSMKLKRSKDYSSEDSRPDRKVIKKAKKSNTLISTGRDSTSDSDSENAKKNVDSSPKRTLETSKKIHSSSDEDDNESSSKIPGENSFGGGGDFDLDIEAKDVEEMINAMEEEEQVPHESLRKLKKIRIQLRHVVPPQHQIESCAGSRGPTAKQKRMFESFGPIKCGKFTPEEDDIIISNWKSFCKIHDWDYRDVKPFLYMRHRDIGFVTKFTERQKFVQYLADGLPWRTLYSVYWRFRNLHQPHLQSKYTPEEDKLIIAYMENSSGIATKNVRKFAQLAKVLNRTRASVWRRYRLMKQKKDSDDTPVNWTMHSLSKFIKNLMALTLSQDVKQLKDLNIPSVVWHQLSKKLRVDHKELKYLWLSKLHLQLFCGEPVYLNEVKIKLIEYFYMNAITDWWEINWEEISQHFDGMTTLFLSRRFGGMIHDEAYKGMELGDILQHLYEVKIPQLRRTPKDKCLPRLVYKNGKIKLLDVIVNNRPERRNRIEEYSD